MHGHRPCLVILTTFYHMCHLLYSATGDVVKVVYTILQASTVKHYNVPRPHKGSIVAI